MKLHLYWIDSKWKAERRTANNYNLIVDIEVKKQSDIEKYVDYLRKNGFTPSTD